MSTHILFLLVRPHIYTSIFRLFAGSLPSLTGDLYCPVFFLTLLSAPFIRKSLDMTYDDNITYKALFH
ncbi:hypothetical protein CLOSPI_02051 [Thomasclavelia spiroformis DSM 1552]|uniref:Uncharacterized protein n=1 Tax=Thomasclavelia spiroformis DSM 1552 TaxID=428126 RepID=B1C484_9FIRM|nr:hypothetical protein CLOSPI_02051 [Thomasclavelia spiroformis DSM 1552]